MKQLRGDGEQSMTANALAYFTKLKAAGAPVSIKRVPKAA